LNPATLDVVSGYANVIEALAPEVLPIRLLDVVGANSVNKLNLFTVKVLFDLLRTLPLARAEEV